MIVLPKDEVVQIGSHGGPREVVTRCVLAEERIIKRRSQKNDKERQTRVQGRDRSQRGGKRLRGSLKKKTWADEENQASNLHIQRVLHRNTF